MGEHYILTTHKIFRKTSYVDVSNRKNSKNKKKCKITIPQTIDLKKINFLQKKIVFDTFDLCETLINKKNRKGKQTLTKSFCDQENMAANRSGRTRFKHRIREYRRKNVRHSLFRCYGMAKEEYRTIDIRAISGRILSEKKLSFTPRECILSTSVLRVPCTTSSR